MELTMCCPTLFGLEGIVADELRFGGKLTEVRAENGRVFFEGDEATLAWANLNLRCAERVLIRLPGQDLRPAVRGRQGAAVGAVHPEGRRVPGEGPQSGLRAAFHPGLPEDHQKGGRQPSGAGVRPELVRGDRREVSDPVRHHARHGRAVP